MSILENLQPKEVFLYFEQISQIPRGSGNMDKISDFLAEFAKKQGLTCVQDKLKNIILIKEASEGYEAEPAVILQGHMDMVAVKKPGCQKDMLKEGLDLCVEGDTLFAKDTSLGGDDGIAVAYCMALLASKDIPHPKLEVILTVEEEVGMDGARGIDVSMLTGKQMINLDSEEEGIFLTSCAGGARAKVVYEAGCHESKGKLCKVTIGGLQGGHSGAEIHKERGNANCLLSRVLLEIANQCDMELIALAGGLADNAIPREAYGSFLLSENACQISNAILERMQRELSDEYVTRDSGLTLAWEWSEVDGAQAVNHQDTLRVLRMLTAFPNGVQSMSQDVKGLVETSLNMGILKMEQGRLTAEFAVRSSVESKKRELLEKVTAIAALAGGACTISGDYPGWKYRVDSPLRDKLAAVYEKMYHEKPLIEAIHAGVECGFLVDKIPGLDCVSLGPDMTDIHTTEEKLRISSVKRVWEFLLEVLKTKTEN